jgi:hypothetical protein
VLTFEIVLSVKSSFKITFYFFERKYLFFLTKQLSSTFYKLKEAHFYTNLTQNDLQSNFEPN